MSKFTPEQTAAMLQDNSQAPTGSITLPQSAPPQNGPMVAPPGDPQSFAQGLVPPAAPAAPASLSPEQAAAALGGGDPTAVKSTPANTGTPGFLGLGKVADFLGIGKFGQGVGAMLNNTFNGAQNDHLLALSQQHAEMNQKLVELLKKPNLPEAEKTKIKNLLMNSHDDALDTYRDITTANGMTDKEFLGSAAQLALNVALAGGGSTGVGTTGKLITSSERAAALAEKFGLSSSLVTPLVDAAEGGIANTAKRIAAKTVTNAGIGAAFGAAQGVTDNKDPAGILQSAAISALINGTLGGGAQAGGELLRAITSPGVVEDLYNRGIGAGKRLTESGRSPTQSMIDNGWFGTARTLAKKAQGLADEGQAGVSNILDNSDKRVNMDTFYQNLADELNAKKGNVAQDATNLSAHDIAGLSGKNINSNLISADELRQHVKDLLPDTRTLTSASDLHISDANQIRSELDHTIGDQGYTSPQLTAKKDKTSTIVDALRAHVQNLEPGTVPEFEKWSNGIQAVKTLQGEIAKPHIMRHVINTMLLSPTNWLNPILGASAAGAGALNIALGSTEGQTTTAIALKKIGDLVRNGDTQLTPQLIKLMAKYGITNSSKNAGN